MRVFAERVRHVAHGEADDRRTAGASKGHAEVPSVCGHADGLRQTSPAVPGEQVRKKFQRDHLFREIVLTYISFK